MRDETTSGIKPNDLHRWVRRSGPPFPKEILEFGYDNPRHALTLSEHVHENAFEFVVIEKGLAAWELDEGRFQTRAGDVFHTRPGEVHRGGYEVIEPCRFWWIQLEIPAPSELHALPENWLSMPPVEATPLVFGIWNLPRVHHCGPLITTSLKGLRETVERHDPLSHLKSRVAVIDFLVRLLQPERHSSIPSDVLAGLEEITNRMNASPDWHPRIPELANRLGVSVSHFHRIFRDYTGLSPMNYVERLRMQEACYLLETTDDSITKISFDLGYATSQHFATVFRRITGKSPSQWRRK
ncbi:AraC family transcriptional regulator [Alicyclobacillus fodiniaquatilis]|uniref:AraC family transcriptional regulator n=1 Tax=Alicyclobacillus fodiniaquatilis TaxID=1661150 RepID=A0ABW4JIN1_9BACL